MPGRLILCATPIGNLGDVSARLVETLASADLIYVEDTRRSKVLLDSVKVKQPLRSFFAGNENEKANELTKELEMGKTVVLITDAGTPAIADPGLSAVRAARAAGAPVSVVPGPSALTAALAVSGMPSERFVFEGFLPRKGKERKARLEALTSEERTAVIFVGSAHVLADLEDLAGLAPSRSLCIARELTKAFEEVQWTTCREAFDEWQIRTIKGEFTLVLAGAEPAKPDFEAAVSEVLERLEQGEQMSGAVRSVAQDKGHPRRELYEVVLARTRDTSRGR